MRSLCLLACSLSLTHSLFGSLGTLSFWLRIQWIEARSKGIGKSTKPVSIYLLLLLFWDGKIIQNENKITSRKNKNWTQRKKKKNKPNNRLKKRKEKKIILNGVHMYTTSHRGPHLWTYDVNRMSFICALVNRKWIGLVWFSLA